MSVCGETSVIQLLMAALAYLQERRTMTTAPER